MLMKHIICLRLKGVYETSTPDEDSYIEVGDVRLGRKTFPFPFVASMDKKNIRELFERFYVLLYFITPTFVENSLSFVNDFKGMPSSKNLGGNTIKMNGKTTICIAFHQ